ncbi:MAG: DUF1254 domain-containing protein [Pseudomonadota bacterium]|nr:DUF1254 domain-containing protein [Pseudomonadota bacterium]
MWTIRDTCVILVTAIVVHLLIVWQTPDWIMEAFERQLINNAKYGDNTACGETYVNGVYYIDPKCMLKKDRGTMPNLDVLYTICFYQVDANSDYMVTTNVPTEKNFWVTHVYEEDTTIAYYINNDDVEGEMTLQIARDNGEKNNKNVIEVTSSTNTGMVLIRAFYATEQEKKALDKERRKTRCYVQSLIN